MTEDRDNWRKYVHSVHPRIEDGCRTEQNRTEHVNWTELAWTSRPSYTKRWLVIRTVQHHVTSTCFVPIGYRRSELARIVFELFELRFVRCERSHWFVRVQNLSSFPFSSCDVNKALFVRHQSLAWVCVRSAHYKPTPRHSTLACRQRFFPAQTFFVFFQFFCYFFIFWFRALD